MNYRSIFVCLMLNSVMLLRTVVRRDILKRRLQRFGFDVLKLRNFQNVCQKQSNVDVPWVCCTHASILYCQWRFSACWQLLVSLGCFAYRRGASALLVLTDRAMRRPQNVKRATMRGFTLFLCLLSTVETLK